MRFRPRFSVRTLAIFVTLVCVYFVAWEATTRAAQQLQQQTVFSVDGWRSMSKVDAYLEMFAADKAGQASDGFFYVALAESPAPFVIATYGAIQKQRRYENGCIRRYYLWLFGPTIKLPFETEG